MPKNNKENLKIIINKPSTTTLIEKLKAQNNDVGILEDLKWSLIVRNKKEWYKWWMRVGVVKKSIMVKRELGKDNGESESKKDQNKKEQSEGVKKLNEFFY